jgi:hypothetical protein
VRFGSPDRGGLLHKVGEDLAGRPVGTALDELRLDIASELRITMSGPIASDGGEAAALPRSALDPE